MKLTPKQKLAALSLRFYQGYEWNPKKGDLYTTSRDDLEVYEIVDIKDGKIYTRYTEGSETISEWDEATFLTEGFGSKRIYVPNWTIEDIPSTILSLTQQTYMLNRFLSWELPKDFNPDGGISYERNYKGADGNEITRVSYGTNLLTFAQAKNMLDYMLYEIPLE